MLAKRRRRDWGLRSGFDAAEKPLVRAGAADTGGG